MNEDAPYLCDVPSCNRDAEYFGLKMKTEKSVFGGDLFTMVFRCKDHNDN